MATQLKVCPVCGVEFSAPVGRRGRPQLYCTREHAMEAAHTRFREKKSIPRATAHDGHVGWYQDEQGTWWYGFSRGTRVRGTERTCLGCGIKFPWYKSGPANTGDYHSRECANRAHKPKRHRSGPDHPNWRGGRGVTKEGYVEVYDSTTRRRVQEHRQVMEEHLGRKLSSDETVHHRNGVKHDNRIENLQLWTSRHPRGQAVEDLVAFAHEILDLYGGIADLE